MSSGTLGACVGRPSALPGGEEFEEGICPPEASYQNTLIARASLASKAAYDTASGLQVRAFLEKDHYVLPFGEEGSSGIVRPAGIVVCRKDWKPGEERETVIAFHGTQGLRDVLTDLCAWKTESQIPGVSGRIHSGFQGRYIRTQEGLSNALERMKSITGRPSDSFLCTGHSMGAALANLAAAERAAGDKRWI